MIIETILCGAVAGALSGLSIGPVAVWGAQLWREGYRDALAVIAGASTGNIVVGTALLALAWSYEVPLPAVRAVLDLFTVPGLFLAAAALFWMAMNTSVGGAWSESRRFVTAFAITAFWPGTAALTAMWLIWLLPIGDDTRLFPLAFSCGAVGMWCGNVWFFHKVQVRAPFFIRALGAGCAFLATAKFVLPVLMRL